MREETFVTKIVCSLPEDGFGEWEEMSEETRALFYLNQIPCDGMGIWPGTCDSCPFCKRYTTNRQPATEVEGA